MTHWLCLTTVTLAAQVLAAPPPPTGAPVPAMSHYDAWFEALVNEYPGLQVGVAVSRHQKVIYNRAFGGAEPTSRFRIASCSKALTSAAILQLVEQGKLKLGDKVVELLDLKPKDERWRQITLLELLHHRAGFNRDKSGDPMFRSLQIARSFGHEPPAMQQDIIDWMAQRPLDFDPGTDYNYSNFGYCLLGRVVEKASGETYEHYVQSHVFAPLGVHGPAIGHSLPDKRPADEVPYLSEYKSALVFPPFGKQVPGCDGGFCVEAMDAHGGWTCTAEELLRFLMAFDRPSASPILSAESIARIFARPEGDKSDGPVWYGCGWSVRNVGRGERNTWHNGALDGTSTLMVRRSDGLDWTVFFNKWHQTDKQDFSGAIDGKMHELADQVKQWP